ncbi:hypothetical protein AB0I35_15250 [Nocardia sp. NPDC050378]|uniref:hypothetical protein n=1 Tax=Nocardia sp. NPDC050378 TaxID=3155400 RepID=UPI00340BDC20
MPSSAAALRHASTNANTVAIEGSRLPRIASEAVVLGSDIARPAEESVPRSFDRF